ncbi:MAG: RIP metalloprotease RseP [Acidimicrobiia bacterium]
MLLTIGAAIFVIGVLIFVHELGHFIAAKAVGIGVPRFSIGLGPRTPLSFRRGETEYVISWIPFGGYVKMASKEEQEEAMAGLEGGALAQEFPPEKLFENKPLWARVIVISAGVAMNFLFAWAVYFVFATIVGRYEDPATTLAAVEEFTLPPAAALLVGLPENIRITHINGDTIKSWNDVRDLVIDPTSDRLRFAFVGADPVVIEIDGFALDERVALYGSMRARRDARIGLVVDSSAAEEAGFEAGDVIVSVDGEPIRYWHEMARLVQGRAGQAVEFRVDRDGVEISLTAQPKITTQENAVTGAEREVGSLGVYGHVQVRRVTWGLAGGVVEGARRVKADARLILVTLKGLVTGRVSARELGGPVLIGQISGTVARQGLIPLLAFMALFSVNLAILNLLPIPVLDGGQLVFLLIEGVRGKPMPLELRVRFSQFGLVILLGIMVLALTNDLLRVFGG